MFHELYKSIVIIHKLVSHNYFMDQMQIPDLSLITKYLEFADVELWDMTRRIMVAAAGPNLKTKYRDPKVLLPLVIDDDGVIHTTEMTESDLEKCKRFNEYVKQMEKKKKEEEKKQGEQ